MNLTINETYNNYLMYAKLKQKPQSIRSIASRFSNYILPYLGKIKINNLTAMQYLEWQSKIEGMNFSYRYKKALHYSMVALYNFCITFYDINKNIPSKVGNFKNKFELECNVDFWTFEEYSKFISKVDDVIYKKLFDTLYFTGIRQGEALALTWNDFNNDILNINKTISKERINGMRVITTPKTKKSVRKIHIDYYLKIGLEKLMLYYTQKYKNFNSSYYIFGGINPLAPTTVERKKNNYCKLANVKQIRIHDFRHSHASLLLSKNIPITAISSRLGHSDITLTLNTYSHLMPGDEKRVINTLNSLRLNN